MPRPLPCRVLMSDKQGTRPLIYSLGSNWDNQWVFSFFKKEKNFILMWDIWHLRFSSRATFLQKAWNKSFFVCLSFVIDKRNLEGQRREGINTRKIQHIILHLLNWRKKKSEMPMFVKDLESILFRSIKYPESTGPLLSDGFVSDRVHNVSSNKRKWSFLIVSVW